MNKHRILKKKLNWLTFKKISTHKTLNSINTAIYNNLPKYIMDSINNDMYNDHFHVVDGM